MNAVAGDAVIHIAESGSGSAAAMDEGSTSQGTRGRAFRLGDRAHWVLVFGSIMLTGLGIIWGHYAFIGPDLKLMGPWSRWVALAVLIIGLVHAMLKCSPAGMGFGVMGCVGVVMLESEGMGYHLIGSGLVAVLALTVANIKMEARRAETEGCESAEDLAKRNPRCASCHAERFCPYKPGGVADRYKGAAIEAGK